MSKKILKPLLIGAAIIAIGVATGGISFVGTTTIGGVLGGSATVLSAEVLTTGLGGALLAAGAGVALSGVAAGLQSTPHATLSQLDRLNATINPSASRKFVFGHTALATDIRYVEPSGDDQEYIDNIICVAAHRVTSIEELWIDDLQAWSSTAGVMGKFVGYLTVNTVLEGTSSNTIAINGGSKWGTSQRLTGCAYMHLRIKRTGNGKKAESPFVSGLSSRLTIIGKGAPVYDPRLDSTVPGGSGPQRITDQSTWSFDASALQQGSNFALQALAFQLGWRINGKLSVGAGIPPSRLDIASYIQAANLCDETIALAPGGTQKRYTGGGVFGDDTDPGSTITAFANACNGALQDAGGKFKFLVRHNDLAFPAVDLADDDVLSSGLWEPTTDIDQAYNVVRGRYANPAATSLYQLVDYPEVRLDNVDGQDRVLTLDLPLIDDAARAQRIAKQVLERRQYQGKFTANFGARAWNAKVGDIVRVTLSAAGWVNKIFRVEGQGIAMGGSCPLVLREEADAVYAWDAEDRAPVTAAPATIYDPTNSPLVQGIAEAGTTSNWSGVVNDDGLRPADGATVGTPAGTEIYGRPVEDVIADLDLNAESIIKAALDGVSTQALLDARTYIEGVPIGPYLLNEHEERADGDAAINSTIDLIGEKSSSGDSFILNTDTVRVSPTETMATRLSALSSSIADNSAAITDAASASATADAAQAALISSLTVRTGNVEGSVASLNTAMTTADSALASSISTVSGSLAGVSASVSTLSSVVVGPSGSTARAVISLNSAGQVAGIIATNTGATSALEMVFGSYNFLTPSGGSIFYASGGTVYMPDVVINTLAVGSVTTNNLAMGSVTGFVAAESSSSFAGTGITNWQIAVSVGFTLTTGADVLLLVNGRNSYTSTSASNWAARCRVDGSGQLGGTAGGFAYTDSYGFQGNYFGLSAGAHNAYGEWVAAGSQLTMAEMQLSVFWRYR